MSTLTPSTTLSDEPICSHTYSMDHLMISQYWGKSADTTYMAKGLRGRVGKQDKGTQRTRKAVHGEGSVELAKWTFPIISFSREPYEAKVSRTGLTGGLGKRAIR